MGGGAASPPSTKITVMNKTVNIIKKSVVVAFHIGRGGRFFNSGHKTFMPSVNKLQDCFREDSYIYNEYEDGTTMPDEQWLLIDGGGNVILEGRDAIESETGILDWDGEYNTDIVRYIEDCTEEELEIIYQAYLNVPYLANEIHDDNIIDYVCQWKGVKRIDEEPEIGSDEYIIDELSKFLLDEPIEENPINIISREDIEGENAELVRFTFSEYGFTCVAVVYDDGTVYTPMDWQTPVWEEEGWTIPDTEHWMDCNFHECIMFNGMPRILFDF